MSITMIKHHGDENTFEINLFFFLDILEIMWILWFVEKKQNKMKSKVI